MHDYLGFLISLNRIETSQRSSHNNYRWDGRSLALNYSIGQEGFEFDGIIGKEIIRPYDDQLILHEVCHWMVASQEERTQPEYGLDTIYADSVMPKQLQDFREECATQLGHHFHPKLDIDLGKYYSGRVNYSLSYDRYGKAAAQYLIDHDLLW